MNERKEIPETGEPSRQNVFVTVAGSPFMGRSDANVTIVEFSDFECPVCGDFARTTLPRIVSDYVSQGKVRYVSRPFSQEQSYPRARLAAESSLCANEQGKCWEVHERF